MTVHRIAMELFGHAVLMMVGLYLKMYSIGMFKCSQIPLIISTMRTLAEFNSLVATYVSSYLIERTKDITVNSNEVWYRVVVYELIWNIVYPGIR